jgi:hypothetical protein
MKLAVVGCSWSFGVKQEWSRQISNPEQQHKIPDEDFVCWPRELGKLKPDWDITNYSLPGASIFYCASMLERIKASKEYDLVIFQATTPYRFVYWNDNLLDNIVWTNIEPNVKCGTEENLKNITIVNIHEQQNTVIDEIFGWRDAVRENSFVKQYYKRISNDMFESEFRILCDWSKNNSDIFFSHLNYEFLNCETVEGTLGKKKFKEYSVDSGNHFGYEGSRWQAQWVLDKINTL